MDFNNLEHRISVLYKAIDFHYAFQNLVVPKTEEYEENGKKYMRVTIGASITNDDAKFEAYNRMILVIHHIANLKDNLKKFLFEKNLEDKIIEDRINDSLHLSVITDLSNAEKHGYPLTKFKRSKLDPKIINIRKEWNVKFPLTKVFYNPMNQGEEYVADIVDFQDNLVCTFNELIDKAIENWEDFFIDNLKEVSTEIITNRLIKEQKQKQILKVQHTIDEVKKILDSSEWIDILWQDTVQGMIVRCKTIGSDLWNYGGIIVNQFIDENSTPTIVIKNDMPFGISNYHAEKYKWQMIKIIKPNDLMVLSYYYYNFDNLIQSVN
ncbi:hypothetical protein [Flavobacterium sp.]|uniref:hypothetical protein n=1 Tax=Flavobacterium sp. TaxID=239 RepID=UPI002FDEAD67